MDKIKEDEDKTKNREYRQYITSWAKPSNCLAVP